MGLNDTPRGERLHIALFGKRNAGKSSLVNALTGQELSIVSEVKGTTTDPVYKAMELLPLGPVMMVDTPGLDDEGELGKERVKRAKSVLNKTDIALVIADSKEFLEKRDLSFEKEILSLIEEKKLPCIFVWNKVDEVDEKELKEQLFELPEVIAGGSLVSAKDGKGIHELKERLSRLKPELDDKRPLVADLLSPMDVVVLVVPIDESAPKGRLILPQQQVIRDALEASAITVVTKETELKETLSSLGKKPRLVITDSQAFSVVDRDTPEDILLTSFSILFARYKGELKSLIRGAKAIENLKDGDTILMAEGCTHHRQCNDIGTVKIPNWLRQYTGKELKIETSSGTGFPENLEKYALVIHCGACMLHEKEMKYRIREAEDLGVPIVNYGVAIAYMKGILKRSLEPFKEELEELLYV